MIRIGKYIISSDLLEKKFCCDLQECRGNCCRYGDAGAPLTVEEVDILEKIRPAVLPYLTEKGRHSVELYGTSTIDIEGEHVTPLIEGEECAYSFVDDGILKCAIEKAWEEGKISFRKPLSCHLFPVRVTRYSDFTAINVEEWPICFAGREKGRKEGIALYEFLEGALTRLAGEEVYREICNSAKHIRP